MLAGSDLGLFAYSFYPSAGPEKYSEPPVAAFLNRDKSLFRTLTFCKHRDLAYGWDVFQGSASMPWSISSANGFNSLQTRRYTDYLFSPSASDVSYGFFSDKHALHPESPLLSSLNVSLRYCSEPRACAARKQHAAGLQRCRCDRLRKLEVLFPRLVCEPN